MSQDTSAATITEALERAAALHAEALRQVAELLRDDEPANDASATDPEEG
ncbi:MAG: hypothetical protein IPJ65_28300 [Archangiaceae bacterium]|nr:hypothetical protein [Archangiaceae bacterium]